MDIQTNTAEQQAPAVEKTKPVKQAAPIQQNPAPELKHSDILDSAKKILDTTTTTITDTASDGVKLVKEHPVDSGLIIGAIGLLAALAVRTIFA